MNPLPRVPTQAEIHHRIAQLAAEKPVRIKTATERVYRDLGHPAAHARSEAARRSGSAESYLDDQLRSFQTRRLTEYFKRNPTKPSLAVPVAGAGVYKWTPVAQSIIMDLPPRSFEILVANLLASRECEAVILGPGTGDGGFDFIGRRDLEHPGVQPPEAITGPSILAGQKVFIFGQGKRYALRNRVGVPAFANLSGSYNHLRDGGGTPILDKLRDDLLAWGWSQNSQTILSFATSGVYTDTVPGLAFTHKYSILDGEQLAQRLLFLYQNISSEADLRKAIEDLANSARANVTVRKVEG